MIAGASRPEPAHAGSLGERIFAGIFPLCIAALPFYLGGVRVWWTSLVLAPASAAYLLYQSGRIHKTPPPGRAMDLWLALYLAAFTASAFLSRIPSKTGPEALGLFAAVFVLLAAREIGRERDGLTAVCHWIVLSGTALSFFGLLQYGGVLPKSWWQRPDFLSASYVNHNHFAGWLEIALPLSIACAWAEREAGKKMLLSFCAAVLALALALSMSRGAWISLVPALFVLALLLWGGAGRKKVWIACVGLTAGLALAFLAATQFGVEQRLSTLKDPDLLRSEATRVLIWKGSLDSALASPWVGSGPGTFDHVFLRHRPLGLKDRAGHAHNDYLELWTEIGLLGLVAALGLALQLLWTAWKVRRGTESRARAAAAAAFLSAMTAYAAHSFVDFNFHIPANWFALAALAGCATAASAPRPGRSASERTASAPSGWIGVLTAVCVLLGGAWIGASDLARWKARQEFEGGDLPQAKRWLERSLALYPTRDEAHYLQGLVAESEGSIAAAKQSFAAASQLNPLEPYYLYQFAKQKAALYGPEKIGKIVPYFRKAVDADPRDAAFRMLCARQLLRFNTLRDPVAERAAVEMLRQAVVWRPSLASQAYQTLWRYRRDVAFLQEFHRSAPSGIEGYLSFLRRNDLWQRYRAPLLESAGRTPARVAELLATVAWRAGSEKLLGPADFEDAQGRSFRRGPLMYTNGEAVARVMLGAPRTRLTLRARGSRALGAFPFLVVRLDGKVVDGFLVDRTSDYDYETVIETSPGPHLLSVGFINDRRGGRPPRDRNLVVETVKLQEGPLQAEGE